MSGAPIYGERRFAMRVWLSPRELAARGLTAQDVEQADEKQIITKGRLKAAIKGIAFEFPELAHLAHLALNPITLALTGLVLVVGKVRDTFRSFSVCIREFSGPMAAGSRKSMSASTAARRTSGDGSSSAPIRCGVASRS